MEAFISNNLHIQVLLYKYRMDDRWWQVMWGQGEAWAKCENIQHKSTVAKQIWRHAIIISDINTSNKVVLTCKVCTSWSPLSLQQSGVKTWKRALHSVEWACLSWMCQDSNRHCVWVWGWESITLAFSVQLVWCDWKYWVRIPSQCIYHVANPFSAFTESWKWLAIWYTDHGSHWLQMKSSCHDKLQVSNFLNHSMKKTHFTFLYLCLKEHCI